MPRISIIIPSYNAEEYIKECIESVINQIFKDIEIICIDDGSTDNTGKILDAYMKVDERIKVVHQSNAGIAASRKCGLNMATGEYVAFVDSDDWIKSNMYQKMYYCAKEYNVDAVYCGYYSVKPDSCIEVLPNIRPGIYKKEKNNPIHELLYDLERSKKILNWTYWTYLFRKSVIYDYVMRVTNIEQGEDIVGVWSFLANAEKVYVLNEPYYYYRVRQGSSCRKENPNYLSNINEAYILLKEEFEKNNNANFLLKILKYAMFDIVQSGNCFTSERQDFFMFPYEIIPLNSKIVLYGAGLVGMSYYKQIKENHYCEIVLWVDRSYENIRNEKYTVLNPKMIKDVEYEYILIAILEYEEAKKMAINLSQTNQIPLEKIIVYEPKRLSKFLDLEDLYEKEGKL